MTGRNTRARLYAGFKRASGPTPNQDAWDAEFVAELMKLGEPREAAEIAAAEWGAQYREQALTPAGAAAVFARDRAWLRGS